MDVLSRISCHSSPRTCTVQKKLLTPVPPEGAFTPYMIDCWSVPCPWEQWAGHNAQTLHDTISRGCTLHSTVKPPQIRGIMQSKAVGKATHNLQEDISSMLEKRAIRSFPPEHSQNIQDVDSHISPALSTSGRLIQINRPQEHVFSHVSVSFERGITPSFWTFIKKCRKCGSRVTQEAGHQSVHKCLAYWGFPLPRRSKSH